MTAFENLTAKFHGARLFVLKLKEIYCYDVTKENNGFMEYTSS